MILTEAFNTVAIKNGTKPAIHFLGKDITYADLKARIARLSYLYQKELGATGVRMGFISSNCPAAVATFFAMTNIKATSIFIDPTLTIEETLNWIKESKVTHLAVSGDLLPKVREILQEGHIHLPVLEIEKKTGGEYDTSFSPPPEHIPVEQDPILLLRTGGAHAKPKYAIFTHKPLQFVGTALRTPYHVMPTDRYLTMLNFSHPFAFSHGWLLPLLNGACVVMDHGLEGAEFLEFLVKSRTNRLIGTPAFFRKLVMLCRSEKFTLPGMKSATVGLGCLSSEFRKIFQLLKVPAIHAYGQTESLWTVCVEDTKLPFSEDRHAVGRNLPGLKYKVVDENGDEIEGKEKKEGLFCVTGPMMMQNYLEDPDKKTETKKKIRGTWLYTGDYASIEEKDEVLSIHLLGRENEVLYYNHKVISPEPIDVELKQVKGIDDAAAFLTKNQVGKPIFAVAVVRPPNSPINEKTILDAIYPKLPEPIRPTAVFFTDFIPRDKAGNVLRFKLGNQFANLA